MADRVKQVANGKRATWHAVDTRSIELPDSGRSRRTPLWLYVDTALLANYFPTNYYFTHVVTSKVLNGFPLLRFAYSIGARFVCMYLLRR